VALLGKVVLDDPGEVAVELRPPQPGRKRADRRKARPDDFLGVIAELQTGCPVDRRALSGQEFGQADGRRCPASFGQAHRAHP
jgi:hypothetical protein